MANYVSSTSANPPIFRLEPFKGMNVSVSPTQINDHQSPDMLNCNVDVRGAINKRTGYQRVYSTSLGTGQINGLYEFKKNDGTSIFLIAWGTQLYTQSGNAQPTSIYSGLQNQRVNFFTFNNKCYIMDGNSYLVYDGSTVSNVVPYIPTLFVSKPPAGGGTAYEDFNLLGAGFKESFSGDGTSKVFQLSLTGLDSTACTATVGGTAMTENNGFTVDRTAGKVTFTNAPATGVPNNVIITAYKTVSGNPDKIKKCTFLTLFGGSNDTRVFLSGNPNLTNYVYHLGLTDPTYAPENSVNTFNDKVMGFSKQYDYLVIHRENGMSQVTFEIDSNGHATFPSKPLNDTVGTVATNSIQIIENNPVSLSKHGVYMITATNVKDERNVTHSSLNIDKKLLNETGLENAVSVDYDNKYWLALNGNVYILDYTQISQGNPYGEWYMYNNIHANCFLEMNGYLYFGSSTDGLVYMFNKATNNADSYSDDGQAITAYWKSKPLTFGAEEMRKLIESIYIGISPSGQTSVDITYESDLKQGTITGSDQVIKFNLFDFSKIDFANFTFHFSQFPQVFKRKVKAKKVSYFQLILQNDKLNEGMTVLSLGIKYRFQSFIK